MSDVYQFVYSDTNLDAPYNWFDETTTMPGTVPGSTDVAIIDIGQLLTGMLSVATLVAEQGSGAPALSFTGSSTQIAATILDVAGAVNLENGAAVSVDNLVVVGGGSALSLLSGASLNGNSGDGGSLVVGSSAGISVLSVSGINTNYSYSSSTGSLLVGYAASSSATVSVTNGGAVSGTYADVLIGAADGATATLLAAGASSVIELNSSVEIGDLGTGSVRVESGAYVSLGDPTAASIVLVGNSDDGTSSSGHVTVTGRGSLLSVAANLFFGQAGVSAGSLLVSADGAAQISGDTYVEDGSISVTGAGSVFEGRLLQIDDAAGQIGAVISSGGTAGVVTLHLDSGHIALVGGELAVRRSAYVSSGATLSGYGTLATGILYNSGMLMAAGGTLRCIGAVEQTGASRIGPDATLQFDGAVGGYQSVTFQPGTVGTLALGDTGGFAGVVADFVQGDTIDLLGETANAVSLSGNVLTVKNGTSTVARLRLAGSHVQGDFKLVSDKHGGTDIGYSTAASMGQPAHWLHGVSV